MGYLSQKYGSYVAILNVYRTQRQILGMGNMKSQYCMIQVIPASATRSYVEVACLLRVAQARLLWYGGILPLFSRSDEIKALLGIVVFAISTEENSQ
jgi:hypothetical protein